MKAVGGWVMLVRCAIRILALLATSINTAPIYTRQQLTLYIVYKI